MVIGTKVGHGLDLKVMLEESGLANLTSHDLVIVNPENLGGSHEAKFIVYFGRVSVLASQLEKRRESGASQPAGGCGPDNDTWPCAHAQQHHVGALAKTFHVKEHFILDYLGEEMCQQQVFCSDHKSLVVPWGPLSFSQGSLVHSTKTVLQ